MSSFIQTFHSGAVPRQGFDSDAFSYIQAIEDADGEMLESAVREAVNSFVIGCKDDGIWNAIKACCILAGARTVSGCLVPLAGPAPTNVGDLFVAGDYNRKTGLKGNGSTKRLSTNRNNNTDPQNSRHLAIFSTEGDTISNNCRYIAAGDSSFGDSYITGGRAAAPVFNFCSSSTNFEANLVPQSTTGFIGVSRSASNEFLYRADGTTRTAARNSQSPRNEIYSVYGRAVDPTRFVNARIAFYSIGESLDLALLDTRITAFLTTIGAAI